MKEPVDHIIRPRLPWRPGSEPALTECGYDASKVKSLTRPEFFHRLKDCGQQRTAMITCMTCIDTARRWPTWEDDPRKAVEREINWECAWRGNDRGERLLSELLAVAAIIEAHPDEFARLIAQRSWIKKKEQHQKG